MRPVNAVESMSFSGGGTGALASIESEGKSFGIGWPADLPTPEAALPGRDTPMPTLDPHRVLGTPLQPPFPDGLERLVVGMGCFWGAERLFWELPGVYSTAVGYAGGYTPNPTYQEVCSGKTGHNEVDGEQVPVRHFGVILTPAAWQTMADKLTKAGINFLIEPQTRFKGQPGEQSTMFFKDPSGNALEFKAFAHDSMVFAK